MLSEASLINDSTLLIKVLIRPNVSLSTSVIGGGLGSNVKYVIFKTVGNDFSEDPTKYSLNLLHDLGIDPKEAMVFLTASDVRKYIHTNSSVGSTDLEVYVTIGLNEYPACTYPNQDYGLRGLGTVNTLVITNYGLNLVGITDLLRHVAEVKASLVSSIGYSCINSRAYGTSSDALGVISLRGDGDYAGAVTDVGKALRRAMYEAFSKFVSELGIEDYLRYLMGGVGINELIKVALSAYSKAPIPNLSSEEFTKLFRDELLKVLKDVNTVLLIRSLRMLDEVAHLTKGLNWSEFIRDTKAVVSDELLGCALADYLGGFKAVLCYYWLERLKERGEIPLINEAPMFTDDLINSLVASVMSRVYSKYLST